MCLSVCQPYAHAIIHGTKRIENRTWTTRFRGPLLIHASKSKLYITDCEPEDFAIEGITLPKSWDDLDWGKVIGIVDVVDVVDFRAVKGQPFAEGPFCWLLNNPRAVVPVPVRGQRSIFPVPDALIKFPTP